MGQTGMARQGRKSGRRWRVGGFYDQQSNRNIPTTKLTLHSLGDLLPLRIEILSHNINRKCAVLIATANQTLGWTREGGTDRRRRVIVIGTKL